VVALGSHLLLMQGGAVLLSRLRKHLVLLQINETAGLLHSLVRSDELVLLCFLVLLPAHHVLLTALHLVTLRLHNRVRHVQVSLAFSVRLVQTSLNIKSSALVLLLVLGGLSAGSARNQLLAVGLEALVLGDVAPLEVLLLGWVLLMCDFAIHVANIVKQFNFNAC
jgi:hypothetical protein